MNTTVKCTHAGCDWSTTKPGKEKAAQALNAHVTMKHGKGQEALRAGKHIKRKPPQDEASREKRRQYQRDWAAGRVGHKKKQQAMHSGINLCPMCGCNIAAINAAIALTGGGK